MAKNNKKQAVKSAGPTTTKTGMPVHGLWGVLLLIVCASIVYANYRVFFGVEELIPRLMLAPSSIAVVAFLVYKSTK